MYLFETNTILKGSVTCILKLPDRKLAIGSNGGSNAHTNNVNSFALLNDKVTLISGANEEQSIKMWNLKERSPPSTSQKLFGHPRPVTSLSMLKDNRLVSGSMDDTIIVWKFESLKSTVNSMGIFEFF